MKEILGDTSLVERENFVMELVDLFYWSKQGSYLKFENLTSYLIEHEIKQGDTIE